MKRNKYYIRFGDIPKNEKSNKYLHGELFGSEIGVSVYDAVKMNGVWSVVLPVKVNENTIITYNILRLYQKMKVYLVVGEEVGIGSDNEPLIKNIKIIREITNKYYNK